MQLNLCCINTMINAKRTLKNEMKLIYFENLLIECNNFKRFAKQVSSNCASILEIFIERTNPLYW